MQESILLNANKVTSFAEVRKCLTSSEQSVHVIRDFVEGEIFAKFGSKENLKTPNYLTVQVSDNEHIMLDPEWLQYINHSCEPNVFFDPQKGEVVVLKPIEKGEEVTFFYPSTEWSMEQSFECFCNKQGCFGKIQGAKFIAPDVLKNYNLSTYIQKQIG